MLNFISRDTALSPSLISCIELSPREKVARFIPIMLTLLFGVAAALAASHYLSQHSYDKARATYQQDARDRATLIQNGLETIIEEVKVFSAFFNASEKVERHEFHSFTDPELIPIQYIKALQWAPRVSHGQRGDFEKQTRATIADFQITELDSNGEYVQALERPDYFPILFSEPSSDNQPELGFDIASNPVAKEAMNRARDSANPQTSRPLVLPGLKSTAVLTTTPVYKKAGSTDNTEQRRQFLDGFIVSIYLIDQVVDSVMSKLEKRGVDFLLQDVTDNNATETLYLHQARTRAKGSQATIESIVQSPWSHSNSFNLAGREWRFIAAPAPDCCPVNQPLLYIAPTLLLVFSILTAAYMLSMTRRTCQIRRLANQRGEALEALSLSESGLAEAQQLSHIGNWELDHDSNRLHWSDEVYRILELEVGTELTAEGFLERVHPDDCETVKQSVTDSLKYRIPYELEHRLTFPDGRIKWVRKRCKTLFDNDDQPTRTIGTIQDISYLKHADERQRLAATVFDNTTEAIIISDAERRIVAVNPAFADITGYDPEEVVGQNPRIMKSDRHDHSFYRGVWESINQSGRWNGEIWNRRKDGSIFPAWQNISSVYNDQGTLTHYVAVFSDISRIKQSHDQLEYLAHHDPLTELPNRLLFSARLEHALARSKRDNNKVGLLFLDLDRFKNVNDSLGHPIGDHLLTSVSKRIQTTVRSGDTVARLGGDEFTLVLESLSDASEAATVAEKLLRILQTPFEIEGHEIFINASIGISLYPDDGDTVTTLLKNADAAMYKVKEEGRNGYQFYREEISNRVFNTFVMETDLRNALINNELELHYQPQVTLETGELIGVEALMRWRHPQKGIIPPDRFIPLAEETGLIIPMGEWALREACSLLDHFDAEELASVRVSVNIAPPQIGRGNLVDFITSLLDETKIDPQRLELEITENFIMHDTEHALSVLNGLRALGISLAIDDFGTGFSSLSYLKRLPIDRLKIDRSFIRELPANIDDSTITHSILGLGRGLNFSVIAEGIETEEQREFLEFSGCKEGQGYFFAKPLARRELLDWIGHRKQ